MIDDNHRHSQHVDDIFYDRLSITFHIIDIDRTLKDTTITL